MQICIRVIYLYMIVKYSVWKHALELEWGTSRPIVLFYISCWHVKTYTLIVSIDNIWQTRKRIVLSMMPLVYAIKKEPSLDQCESSIVRHLLNWIWLVCWQFVCFLLSFMYSHHNHDYGMVSGHLFYRCLYIYFREVHANNARLDSTNLIYEYLDLHTITSTSYLMSNILSTCITRSILTGLGVPRDLNVLVVEFCDSCYQFRVQWNLTNEIYCCHLAITLIADLCAVYQIDDSTR